MTDSATSSSGAYYSLIAECINVEGMEDMPGHIYFAPTPGATIPDSVAAFKRDVERTASGLRMISGDRFRDNFQQLLAIARLGLLGKDANLVEGIRALEILRETVVREEARKAKSQHLNRLGRAVLFATGFLAIAALLVRLFAAHHGERCSNYLALAAASMPGMWLSFASRKPRLEFEDLYQPEDDLMMPFHRVMYVLGFTVLLALLSELRIAAFSVGAFSTQGLSADLPSAIVFGVACGLSERLLSSTVAPYVKGLLHGSSSGREG